MTYKEYEQKKRECWEEFRTNAVCGTDNPKGWFERAFDRAYALGKQEIKQEIKQEKDAEGEVMLTVSRKRVQEVYAKNIAASNSDGHNSYDYGYYDGVINILFTLFGSKCLPDNVDSLESNVDSLEPKPAVPKLRRGSFAYHDNVKVRITKIKANGDVIAYTKDGYRLIGRECDFEPYTESAEEASPNVNSSDIDIDELVAKGCVPDPAKQFDNILKDSFSKERRLTIAAQMMQGLICAPLVPGVDPTLRPSILHRRHSDWPMHSLLKQRKEVKCDISCAILFGCCYSNWLR